MHELIHSIASEAQATEVVKYFNSFRVPNQSLLNARLLSYHNRHGRREAALAERGCERGQQRKADHRVGDADYYSLRVPAYRSGRICERR